MLTNLFIVNPNLNSNVKNFVTWFIHHVVFG